MCRPDVKLNVFFSQKYCPNKWQSMQHDNFHRLHKKNNVAWLLNHFIAFQCLNTSSTIHVHLITLQRSQWLLSQSCITQFQEFWKEKHHKPTIKILKGPKTWIPRASLHWINLVSWFSGYQKDVSFKSFCHAGSTRKTGYQTRISFGSYQYCTNFLAQLG